MATIPNLVLMITGLYALALLVAGYGRACDRRWRPCREDRPIRTWTDDYSNPLAVVDWG